MATCKSCSKNVGLTSLGNLRPHCVPIDQRTNPRQAERCFEKEAAFDG